MKTDRKETPNKKTYYTETDILTELNTLLEKTDELSTKDEIHNYLVERVKELTNQ